MSGLKLFLGRDVKGKSGEDLIEKQNTEIGQMPVVASEAAAYGYEAEDLRFVQAFLRGETPAQTFEDGLEVVKLLMMAYQNAEQGRTIDFPPKGLDAFVPAVAVGCGSPNTHELDRRTQKAAPPLSKRGCSVCRRQAARARP